MLRTRTVFTGIAAAAMAISVAQSAGAADYPKKPINFIVPFGVGGSYDSIARKVFSALGLAFKKPDLMQDLNSLLGGGRVALDSLREALFAQPVTKEKLAEYFKRMQPESHRAIWDMTMFDLPRPHLMELPPLLVLGREHDHLIPASLVELTAHTYGVKAEIFPDLGHGLMLESGWGDVARRILDWLGEQGI